MIIITAGTSLGGDHRLIMARIIGFKTGRRQRGERRYSWPSFPLTHDAPEQRRPHLGCE
jgi:hypothetical protein